MQSGENYQVCVPSTGEELDWVELYESAFPAAERVPTPELIAMVRAGDCLLHRTVDTAGKVLCFSTVEVVPRKFELLTYIATVRHNRSRGVGSAHMKRLLDILQEQYPNHLGLFLEIESVKPEVLAQLAPDACCERRRRLAFYERLGAFRYDGEYRILSFVPDVGPILAELVWFERGTDHLEHAQVTGVIRDIYEQCYKVSP